MEEDRYAIARGGRDHSRLQAQPLFTFGFLVAILLLALGLRLYRIEAQSLWNDEGTSVALAARDLAAITRGAANDIHPPLYYYLLHFWIGLFGKSELAVRSLSALLGTLVVLLVFALGRVLADETGSQTPAARDGPVFAPRGCLTPVSAARAGGWGGANRPFAQRWGRGYQAGLLAALFAALSPFQVYYSQEARMYMLTTFLGAVSVYAFLRLLASANLSGWKSAGDHDQGWPRIALLYAIATILLLYSHYFAVTIVIAENLAFLWWLFAHWQVQRRLAQGSGPGPRRWLLLRWVALQVVVGASYVPWLLLAREQLRVWPAVSEPVSLASLLCDLLRVFSLGLSVPAGYGPVLLGFAVLLLLGMLAPPFRAGNWGLGEHLAHSVRRVLDLTPHAVCALYLWVPVGVMYLLSLQRPMYNPKFLLLCSVPFCLFLAQGVLSFCPHSAAVGTECQPCPQSTAPGQAGMVNRQGAPRARLWLSSALVLAASAFVVASSLYSLQAYYFNPRYARDDYRGIAQYIQAVEGQGDAVLINAPGQIETFTYYYGGELPLYPLPRQRPLDKVQTEADLQQMVQGRKRIFAVLWATDESDPERFVEGWLDQYTYKALDSWYGNVRLVVYAVPEAPVAGHIEYPLNAELGTAVRLLGYNLPSAAGGALQVMPGDILQLTLIWQAIAPMTERYKVFTHVVDAYGHLVGQRDAEPGGGAKITTIWQQGEQVVDNYGLPILPGTPPGDYAIEIGMYSLTNGQRLPVIKDGQPIGDSIVLQSVRVLPALAPPPLSVLGMRRQLDVRFGNVTLLGYDLAKLGQEHEPEAPVHPGDILHLTLFWQAQEVPAGDLAVLLRLQDASGKTWLERRTQPTEGLYPTMQWARNEIIRDQHNLFLPPDLPATRSYRLLLSVERLSSGEQVGSAILLTSVAIQ